MFPLAALVAECAVEAVTLGRQSALGIKEEYIQLVTETILLSKEREILAKLGL